MNKCQKLRAMCKTPCAKKSIPSKVIKKPAARKTLCAEKLSAKNIYSRVYHRVRRESMDRGLPDEDAIEKARKAARRAVANM